MNERSHTQRVRSKIEKRGFVCLKHEDSSTTGMPDSSITGNGQTLWVEDKYLESKAIKAFIRARSLINKKRYAQMFTMSRLAEHGKAQYWIHQNINGVLYTGWVDPKELLTAWHLDNLVTVKDIMLCSQWIEMFETLQ